MKKTHIFKTDIKCSGCVTKITPFLEEHPQIGKWSVDLDNPDKLLEIHTNGLDVDKIIRIGKEAGFTLKEKRAGFLRLLRR